MSTRVLASPGGRTRAGAPSNRPHDASIRSRFFRTPSALNVTGNSSMPPRRHSHSASGVANDEAVGRKFESCRAHHPFNNLRAGLLTRQGPRNSLATPRVAPLRGRRRPLALPSGISRKPGASPAAREW